MKNVFLHNASAMLADGIVIGAFEGVDEEVFVLYEQIELVQMGVVAALIDAHAI